MDPACVLMAECDKVIMEKTISYRDLRAETGGGLREDGKSTGVIARIGAGRGIELAVAHREGMQTVLGIHHKTTANTTPRGNLTVMNDKVDHIGK